MNTSFFYYPSSASFKFLNKNHSEIYNSTLRISSMQIKLVYLSIKESQIFKKMKGYLDVQQTCKMLGVKKTTLYKIYHDGNFRATNDTILHRNKRWFSEQSIERYIQSVLEANK